MAIKLKTEEGAEFSFDTVGEFMEFKNMMDEEEASKELTSTPDEDASKDEEDVPEDAPKFELGNKVRVVENTSGGHDVGTIGEITGVRYVERGDRWSYVVRPVSGYTFEYSLSHKEHDLELCDNDLEVGDKVRVVSAEDGTSTPYHHIAIGSVVEVVSNQSNGGVEVVEDGVHQYLLSHHYEKVESLGKDANGEDLYKGDFVTGTEDNDYAYTNDRVVMEVLGAGKSVLFDEANIIVRIDGHSDGYRVDSTRFVKLADNLEEAKTEFDGINGEEEDELLPVGTKVRMLRPSSCGDIRTGDVGTIKDTDIDCPTGLVYSVRVSSGVEGYGWARREDVEVVEDEQEFKVGDMVKVVGNSHGHIMGIGEVREIKEIDSEEPKYNLSDLRFGQWAGTSDIEHIDSSTKFQSGDVVKVTESFEDRFGDRAKCGAVYNYDEVLGLGEAFVGTVFLGDNEDKLELVCRAKDRLDK